MNLPNTVSGGRELSDAVVADISYVDKAVAVDCNSVWTTFRTSAAEIELSCIGAGAPPLGVEVRIVTSKLLNAVIGRVGHHDRASVNRHRCWEIELAITRGAKGAPLADKISAVGELLTPVISSIDDIHYAIAVHRDAARITELSIVRTVTSPVFGSQLARDEFLDAMVLGVCDINIAATVDGDTVRMIEQ